MLRKLFTGGWYILVTIVVLLAIVISIVRAYPSIYQNYLPVIQENISSILGKPVHMDSIRIDWRGITPQITTRNLTVFEGDDQYEELLNVDKAIISIDSYRSIMRRKITFNKLTFIGGHLEAIRTADERIIVNGIDISESFVRRTKFKNQSDKLKVNLLNSSISIIDKIKKLDYFFDRVDVALDFSGDGFKVSSKFILPKTLGDSFVLSADLRGLYKGFNNINGKLYSKGENINLELLDDFFPKLRVGIRKGVADFQVWGNFTSLKQRTFVGRLGLHDLVFKDVKVPIKNASENEEIKAIEANFSLQGNIEDWQLALTEVNIKSTSHAWPGKQYEISCENCSQQNYTLAVALDYMNTSQVFSTLQNFPFIAQRVNQILDQTKIHGILKSPQLLAQFNENKLIKYAFKSKLEDAKISLPEQGFALSSLVGEISVDHRHGSLNLACDSLGIKIDKILNKPLENQNIKGVVSWQHIDGSLLVAMQKLSVESDEMTASLQGSLQILDKKPYIDVQIDIPYAEAETIKQYLPYKRMKPKLSKWLSKSIVAGTFKDGKLLFHGNPKNFLLKNKPGRFEITANVEDGVLAYRPNWPIASNIIADIEVKNNYFEVNLNQGTILDSSLNNVHAYIDDLKLPRLMLDGRAIGPASDFLKYLQQSSILPENSKVIKHITASGNINLDLDLSLTLTKKLKKQILVEGVVEFDNAGLKVNALSLPFTNLNGKLNFDQSGAEGNGLSAKLYGLPVRAKAIKSSNGRTLLSVSGDFDLDTYFSSNYTKLNKYIKGTAPVDATIDLPRFGKINADKSLVVNVNSDLYGVVSLLPEPFFHKVFDQTKKVSIRTKHQQGLDSEVYASLENQVFMHALIDNGTSKLTSMELRMGDEQFNLPENGIKISGNMTSLDFSEWRELMDSEDQQAIDVKEIDLSINQVAMGALKIDNVDFHAIKNSQFWVGDISSSVAKGSFEYPIDTNSGSIATASFDYFRFISKQTNSSPTESTELDPRTLPALVVNAKAFEYQDAVFSNVSLKTKPSENGLTIDSLQGNGRDLQVSANGAWTVGEDEIQSTKLTINLVSQNIQNSVSGLGFDGTIVGGEGSVTANFSWPNAPYKFSVASFVGDAKIRFKDGSFSSVKQGGA